MFNKLKCISIVGSTLALLLNLSGCSKEKLFTRLPAEQTGITFANTIIESDSLNPVVHFNIYNGGGLAAGDFNGDGKLDLYFTGNTVSNALYLNQGDWQFKDVTKTAGVDGKGSWCGGAAVTDINQDGRLDIYVAVGAVGSSIQRANLLYVNQENDAKGIPTFKEMATEYGLADTRSCTNAAFFDYDNDGDLDVYLLVNFLDKSQSTSQYRPKVTDGSARSTGQLYRNVWDAALGHPVFINVSKQAGLLTEGYGLGLNICDINDDGWKDIYVTNDFITNDLLWINNKDGTFSNRAADCFKHTSLTAMGNDVVDFNNDGRPEMIALDMMAEDNYRRKQMDRPYAYTLYEIYPQFGYEHQYKRNTLQLNLGERPGDPRRLPIFSEVSLQAGLAYTDWSWTPLCFDADQDGFRDVIITNGYARDLSDNDFAAYELEATTRHSTLDLTKHMPQIKISNYAFRNRGLSEKSALDFEDVTEAWGINQPSYSHAAVYGDFDNDGDLDFVVNNLNEPAFVYRNNRVEQGTDGYHFLTIRLKGTAQNPLGYGSKLELITPKSRQVYEISPCRGYLSSQEAVAHFGLGDATSADVLVTWPDGKQQRLTNVNVDQRLTLDYRNARPAPPSRPTSTPTYLQDVTDSLGITYRHEEADFNDFNFQKLLLHKLSQYGPAVAAGDINGDGRDDLFVGGSRGQLGQFFVQQGDGRFKSTNALPDTTGRGKPEEDAGCLLFDADNDGDLDLFVASSGYEQIPFSPFLAPRLYLNTGKGQFIDAPVGSVPNLKVVGSCAKAADYDRDGDLDLFLGGRVKPNYYPTPVSSYVLRNNGGRFEDVTAQVAPELNNIGMVCDALWTDADTDGWPDLLLAGEFMPLTLLKNTNGQLKTIDNKLETHVGLWNSLAAADFDHDGDMDYVAGNVGRNTIVRFSEKELLRVHAGDFNQDGSFDAIPSAYFQSESGKAERAEYPLYSRDDMIKQLLPIRRRFLTYAEFSKAPMSAILTDEERQQATVFSASYSHSVWIENKGNATFALHPLPTLAQTAPVFGVIADDVDSDGHADIVLVGNDYGNELLSSRQDALNGLLLKGDGKGNFIPISPAESGFCVPGDGKGLAMLANVQGQRLVAATENQGPLRLFRHRADRSKFVTPGPLDVRLEWIEPNGQRRAQELYYGNTFYGQSTRRVWLPTGAQGVVFIDSQGKRR